MNKFRKIASADNPGLVDQAYPKLQNFSEAPIKQITNYPQNNSEIIANIGDADCALVSWNTIIDKDVIDACPHLKYIGMCCSLIDESSANVDIKAAHEKGIIVKGVRDYGDEGVIEYIISELIQLLKGLGKYQWQADQKELDKQKLGIIGMGTTGRMLAEAALHFKMDVNYFSRSQNLEMEAKGCKRLPLEELLQQVDILSIHLPKNTPLLTDKHFKLFGTGKILINTTLGISFPKEQFIQWLQQPNNFAIMDGSGMGTNAEEFSSLNRFISTPKISGFTSEAKERLSQKVTENIKEYLS